jgi:membrane-associated PAP2 superfamily phosphatase
VRARRALAQPRGLPARRIYVRQGACPSRTKPFSDQVKAPPPVQSLTDFSEAERTESGGHARRMQVGFATSRLKHSLSSAPKHCRRFSTAPAVFVFQASRNSSSYRPRNVDAPWGSLGTSVITRASQDASVVFVGLALLALWEWSRLDLPLIRLYGSAAGFPWRDHWLTAKILHDGARLVGWTFFALLLLSIWRPKVLAAGLLRRDRIWWIATTLICVALIPMLKRASSTSCPWSLIQFGGELARYVPHWVLGLRDGGPGGCFPSGHASTAFALLPGWFALRDKLPRTGRIYLFIVVVCGAGLAWVQMMRGAHYLSHSLWTAWICWTVSALSWHAVKAWQERGISHASDATRSPLS